MDRIQTTKALGLIVVASLLTACGGIENSHPGVTPEAVTHTPSLTDIWVTNPTPEGGQFIYFRIPDSSSSGRETSH